MLETTQHWVRQIDSDGLALLPAVFSPAEVEVLVADLSAALATGDGDGEAIRNRAGVVYAARNVLQLYPPTRQLWRREPLLMVLHAVLGSEFGLVRALFFDKPPERSWSLAWHKDLTIAVRDNRLPSVRFSKPTRKAGVPHVEAPREVLDAMLTLRIHLDDVTAENGPLVVARGSHHAGKEMSPEPQVTESVLANRGDVLAIRPLVSHSSPNSAPGTHRHRRILHLEFCGQAELGEGYAWHEFASVRA